MKHVHSALTALAIVLVATVFIGGNEAAAQPAPAIPPALITPDKVETRIGPLQFNNGAPSAETAEKVYDTLDFTRALDVHQDARAPLQGAEVEGGRARHHAAGYSG